MVGFPEMGEYTHMRYKRKDTINSFNNLTLKEFGTIQYSPMS